MSWLSYCFCILYMDNIPKKQLSLVNWCVMFLYGYGWLIIFIGFGWEILGVINNPSYYYYFLNNPGLLLLLLIICNDYGCNNGVFGDRTLCSDYLDEIFCFKFYYYTFTINSSNNFSSNKFLNLICSSLLLSTLLID